MLWDNICSKRMPIVYKHVFITSEQQSRNKIGIPSNKIMKAIQIIIIFAHYLIDHHEINLTILKNASIKFY